MDPHDAETRRWKEKVDKERPAYIFNEHREFVRKHFSIDVWTFNARLPTLGILQALVKWQRDKPRNTIVAYMTLPDNVKCRIPQTLQNIHEVEPPLHRQFQLPCLN